MTTLIPDSFEELSQSQYIGISHLIYEGGDKLECHVKAFTLLARIGRCKLLLLDTEFLSRAIKYVEWVFERTLLTEQRIPVFKKLHGPASDFDNLKMSEFHFSEIHYKDLVYEKNEASINFLVAVLYRKAKLFYNKKRDPDGDIRVPFNANEIPYYAKIISRWPMPVKQAIFLWYDTCRQQLINANPMVFKEPTRGFESQFDTGLYGMMRSLAGEKLGSVAAIEEMYVHTAMLELSLIREEEINLENQLQNMRS